MADVRIVACDRWVRAWFGGRAVVDTRRARYVYGLGVPYPVYFVPRADLDASLLVPTGEPPGPASPLGAVGAHAVVVGDRRGEDALRAHADAPPELRDHLELRFDPFDAVTEEDQQVYGHPRDPLHRVDVLPSRRRVQIRVGDLVVADSDRTVALFETGLPTRWYFPWPDVRTDLLDPTDTRTICPYKGFAQYWSLRVEDRVRRDLVWSYAAPLGGVEAIAGRLCFYSERVALRVE